MTIREKVIKRLNVGFNAGLHPDTPMRSHMKSGWADAWSWGISKYGCDTSASEALKWEKWVITNDGEIIEYLPIDKDLYIDREYRVEKS